MIRFSLICTLLVVPAAGCEREPELYSAPAKASPPAQKARPAASVTPVAPRRPDVEVEMMGKVELPPRLRSRTVLLYVAERDCMDPRAKVFSVTRVGEEGKFFSEVFPPSGTDLSLCAAVDEGEGKPARYYGVLDRKLHAVGVGEVVFSDLAIKLKPGAPHQFARQP